MVVLLFILILGLLVLVHELGHFVAARIFGIGVEEFGFGFPPRLLKVKRKNWKTMLSFNLIPLGGFVKIKGAAGDDAHEEGYKDTDSFFVQKAWKKFSVLFAGIGMNIVLGMVLLSIGFTIGMPMSTEGLPAGTKVRDPKIQIISVEKGTPAEHAGLQTGDALLSIDDTTFSTPSDVKDYTAVRAGQESVVRWKRGDQLSSATVTLADVNGRGVLGVSLDQTGVVSYPFFKAIWTGITSTLFIIVQIFIAFWDLLYTLIARQTVSGDIAGPVGIAVLTGQIAQLGFIHILQFTAILSINLGVFNFLPIPALDGGRILFVLIEKIRRKPISQKLEAAVHNMGFLFLLLLVLVITVRDISKFTLFQNLFS